MGHTVLHSHCMALISNSMHLLSLLSPIVKRRLNIRFMPLAVYGFFFSSSFLYSSQSLHASINSGEEKGRGGSMSGLFLAITLQPVYQGAAHKTPLASVKFRNPWQSVILNMFVSVVPSKIYCLWVFQSYN